MLSTKLESLFAYKMYNIPFWEKKFIPSLPPSLPPNIPFKLNHFYHKRLPIHSLRVYFWRLATLINFFLWIDGMINSIDQRLDFLWIEFYWTKFDALFLPFLIRNKIKKTSSNLYNIIFANHKLLFAPLFIRSQNCGPVLDTT